MKKILVDGNVILDVLLDREPHVSASAAVWTQVEKNRAIGLLSAHALTTIHYLVRKAGGSGKANRTVSRLLEVFTVATVDQSVIEHALELATGDFEDAVTAAAASAAGCDLIVTRDPKGYRGSSIKPVTPEVASYILTMDTSRTR